jgi:hypothetical protein
VACTWCAPAGALGILRAMRSALLVLTILALPAVAAESEPSTVIEAEYAFAASAKPLGVRGAFLKYLSPDSILCTPMPVNGVVSTAASEPNADTLEWYPTRSETAASQDMGYTTGPWIYRSADGKNEVHGTFLSVWRKQPDGNWRVALDCGVSHPKPAAVAKGLDKSSRRAQPSVEAASWRDPVAAADARFTSSAVKDAGSALKEFGAPDLQVMVRGVPTAVGIAPAQTLLAGQKLGATWQHVFASQSQDGTLGYTWGFIGDAKAAKPAAVYVNVWRRAEISAPWKIVAQSLQVLPQK